jgi:two-component system LytT family response regulator
MKTRALIVDDEVLARHHLSSLLSEENDFEIAGECGDGRSAVHLIGELAPDLVFLDVQMPVMGGFEVLDQLPAGCQPAVIFVTAFDQFAVRAFDAQAVDYLLKPFRRERFQASLDRVRRGLVGRGGPLPAACATVEPDRMVVKSGDRLIFLPFGELDFLRAAGNYVRIHVGSKSYDVRETITTVESRLPPDRFVRIHRSYIVSLAAILELYPSGGGEYMLALRGGRQLPIGPSYPPLIRQALSNARLVRLGGSGGI